jgi:kynurenine formamidase
MEDWLDVPVPICGGMEHWPDTPRVEVERYRSAPGDYELVCLPLKIQDGDGAPERPALRPLSP